ncbi:ATP-binding protein [Streptomyces sp. DSM 44917]|uniref:ATP-binding protein n=1 Tax=Streptomyces boetiae TaxID=3075541 RepID=A0ABU2LB97_9ACTN|nr:ATP-binding protein [Streptomyces sp. DSM 44917]MDT0308829.1 ATP-binding protein [Streptomyces sp. DSM 44917]
MPTYHRTFPARPEEITRARRWTRAVLGTHPCADDAALVVTELGTNAIAHTTSPHPAFRLAITDDGGQAVTISVTDSGSTASRPHVEHADDGATGGRGLYLVTACATAWQVTGDHHGHTVTAHLRTPA